MVYWGRGEGAERCGEGAEGAKGLRRVQMARREGGEGVGYAGRPLPALLAVAPLILNEPVVLALSVLSTARRVASSP